jgi:preprotein translocase subunit SecD
MTKIRIWAAILLILGVGAGFFVYSSEIGQNERFHFKLGLDLNGGTHLTYGADVSEIETADIDDSMDTLRETIERRVNIFGVSEPLVQVEKGGLFSEEENNYRLIVELPGVTDVSEAIRQIGETPILEFRLQKDLDESASDDLANLDFNDQEAVLETIRNQYEPTGLTGAQLSRASLVFDQISGQPTILLDYNDEGSELLAQITRENIGEPMAIFLDGEIISNPVIRDEITGGQATISGNFKAEEARDLVKSLNFGALPVPIELIETQTIGATLGEETLNHGVQALLIGLGIIFLFLIALYRIPGLIATIALIFYVAFMLALFKLIPVTLTASGLAGLILSIGMAVDANILIFERMKEELRGGASKYDAVKSGAEHAWSSIRDGNITSIISAVVLYWMSGTSLVKGFALVFGIGVLVSMFTAVVVTRTLLLSISKK